MRILRAVLPVLAACAACLPSPARPEEAWRDDGATAQPWSPQPTWIPNPSPTASVRASNGVLVFSVPEPGRAMKFSRPVRPFPLSFYRYLVVRYRAENLRTDIEGYFVYLDDGGGGRECSPLRLQDVQPDGRWHTVAVDAARFAARPAITALAVQLIPTAQGNGRLEVDTIAFVDTLPPGAQELRRSPAPPLRRGRTGRSRCRRADGNTTRTGWTTRTPSRALGSPPTASCSAHGRPSAG